MTNERISHDKSELLNKIGAKEEVVRLDKKIDGKPRPMLVVHKSESAKDAILDKSRVLDSSKQIYFKPDLTQWQWLAWSKPPHFLKDRSLSFHPKRT